MVHYRLSISMRQESIATEDSSLSMVPFNETPGMDHSLSMLLYGEPPDAGEVWIEEVLNSDDQSDDDGGIPYHSTSPSGTEAEPPVVEEPGCVPYRLESVNCHSGTTVDQPFESRSHEPGSTELSHVNYEHNEGYEDLF